MSDIDFGRGEWRVDADGLTVTAGGRDVLLLVLTPAQRMTLARELARSVRA